MSGVALAPAPSTKCLGCGAHVSRAFWRVYRGEQFANRRQVSMGPRLLAYLEQLALAVTRAATPT